MKKKSKLICSLLVSALLFTASPAGAFAEFDEKGEEIFGGSEESAASTFAAYALEETEGVTEPEGLPGGCGVILEEETEETDDVTISTSNALSGADAAIQWTKHTVPVACDNTVTSEIKTSYLANTSDGYMRVIYDGSEVVVEYYDTAFQLTRQGRLPLELGIWGGFFAGSEAYYLVEGQANPNGVDGGEVVRIIKYDLEWNRLGAGKILAENGWEYEIRYPFNTACVNMAEVDGKLYIVTGREGYVDPEVGQGHQGMMIIRMDEETFATEIVFGDFWHSFSQHIASNGSDLFLYECSEGSRMTTLRQFDTLCTDIDDAMKKWVPVLAYGGERTSLWSIPCYASADDIAISSENVLGIGTSIDQSRYEEVKTNRDIPHNIYLTVTPLSDLDKDATNVAWLTDYKGDGKCFVGLNLTKVNDNRFLVTWEEFDPVEEEDVVLADMNDTLSSGTLHYLFVDGSGKKIGKEYTAPGRISDCKPVANGNKVVYFASNGNSLAFYTIDAATGDFQKKVHQIAGEDITWSFKDGVLAFSGSGVLQWEAVARNRYPLSCTSANRVYDYFFDCLDGLQNEIIELTLNKGITAISEAAFKGFSKLQKATLPDGLAEIGEMAFKGCTALRKLQIPDSVTIIGEDILWTGDTPPYSMKHIVLATICGSCTSYARTYAETNGISFEATHTWDGGVVTKAPTTTDKGVRTYTCTSCQATKKKSIAKLLENSLSVANPTVEHKRITLKKATTFQIDAANAQGKLSFTASTDAKNAGIKVSSKGTVTIPKACKAGTYKVTVKAAGTEKVAPATKAVEIKILKSANTLTVTPTAKAYRQAKLKKAVTFALEVTKARGAVSFAPYKTTREAGITISKTGTVTIPKKCPKGTYKITVKAAGNGSYKSGKVIVKVVIK